jgi:hypothetical protein
LVSKVLWRISRVVSATLEVIRIPALFTRTSRRPKSASTFLAAAAMEGSLVTSSSRRLNVPAGLRARRSLRAFSPLVRERAATMMWLLGETRASS